MRNKNQAHSRKSYVSAAVGFAILILGLTFTGTLYLNFVKVDNNWVTDRIKRGTDTLLAAINPATPMPIPLLDQINSTLRALRADITTEQGITQETLDKFQWENPIAGLETSTIEYLPRIGFNEALELESRFGDRISDDFKIVQNENGVISPAPVREEYYPVLLESATQEWGVVYGEDRSLTNPFIKIAMEQARDTGEITIHTFFPLVEKGDQTMVSHYYNAIYENGYVPDTVAERRQKLSGFVSVVSYYPIQKEFAGFYPEAYQGMEVLYFPLSGGYQTLEQSPVIRRGIEAGHIVETTYFLQSQNGAPWMALSRANPELIIGMQTSMRWWVLGIGLVFSFWISGMVFWYRRQSENIEFQLSDRTDSLMKKTEKIKDLDKKLEEIQSQYKLLADNTSEVIYSHDLEGVCTYISPSITKESGFEVEEYIGSDVRWHLTKASAEGLKEKLESLKKDDTNNIESSFVTEYEMRCKDGSVKNMISTISLLLDNNGETIGLQGKASPA